MYLSTEIVKKNLRYEVGLVWPSVFVLGFLEHRSKLSFVECLEWKRCYRQAFGDHYNSGKIRTPCRYANLLTFGSRDYL